MTMAFFVQIAAIAGVGVTLATIALTARAYSALPARVTYPKNYGDGGDMLVPKIVVWLLPAVQAAFACIAVRGFIALRVDSSGISVVPMFVIVAILLVLFFVQSSVMLRPRDRA